MVKIKLFLEIYFKFMNGIRRKNCLENFCFCLIFKQIFFVQSIFCPELEKCLSDCAYIGQLFVKYVRNLLFLSNFLNQLTFYL